MVKQVVRASTRRQQLTATIQIIPVEVQPKDDSASVKHAKRLAPAMPQPVSIGEEIEFELRTLIPVALLRHFRIVDILPTGMSCTDAPSSTSMHHPMTRQDLYRAAYSRLPVPGTESRWNFGNQRLTTSDRDDRRFDFRRSVYRSDQQRDTQTRDGSSSVMAATTQKRMFATSTRLATKYVIDFDAAEVIVSEPLLELTKEFAVETADASDQVTVTITATNNGTAPAYNPRLLDDLTGTGLTYIGNVAGDNPPTNIDTTTYGPESPTLQLGPGL